MQMLNKYQNKTIIKGLTLNELENFLIEVGQPKFRAKQLFNWIYNHNISDFGLMNNLPKDFRTFLVSNCIADTLTPSKVMKSDDSETQKILFTTLDNQKIESVILPDKDRMTLCISTQAGCPLDCKFCATGQMGFFRNLSAGEIVDQFYISERAANIEISNIVYMGMGEPFVNYNETIKSLEIFTNELAKKISRHHITVSTSGIPEKIRSFANTSLRTKLAFSLHSCFEDIRSEIMPINKRFSLKSNIEALEYYYKITDQRVTYEYTLLKGVNDRSEDIKALTKLAKRFPSKINIIPFNSIKHIVSDNNSISAKLIPTTEQELHDFADKLRENNITVFVRNTQGNKIKAACGQLALSEDVS